MLGEPSRRFGGRPVLALVSTAGRGVRAAPAVRPLESAEASSPFSIRFGSYNVRTATLYNGEWVTTTAGFDRDDARRMRRIARTIAGHRHGVVATQEMRAPGRRAVIRRLEALTDHDWKTSNRELRRDDAMVLFDSAKWRKRREVDFRTPFEPGRPNRHQVGVLLQYKQTGRKVWFYSVHYGIGRNATARQHRRKAARRTIRVIKRNANGHPFVLGGDFNEVAGGAAFRTFRRSDYTKYARLVGDRKVNNHCKTWNNHAGSSGRQNCLDRPAPHIDHIWVRKHGMQVRIHKVTANARTSRSSDHNPVTAILRRP